MTSLAFWSAGKHFWLKEKILPLFRIYVVMLLAHQVELTKFVEHMWSCRSPLHSSASLLHKKMFGSFDSLIILFVRSPFRMFFHYLHNVWYLPQLHRRAQYCFTTFPLWQPRFLLMQMKKFDNPKNNIHRIGFFHSYMEKYAINLIF